MLKALTRGLVAASLAVAAGTASAVTVVNEVEIYADGSVALFENIHGGYTGSGYINTINEYGAGFMFHMYVDVEQNPAGTIKIRYANGGNSSRTATLGVNSYFYTVQFPPTGGWNVWREVSVFSPLIWASNEFTLHANTNDGLANIDKVTIVTQ